MSFMISALMLSASSYLFGVGLSVLLTWVFALGLFSSLEALAIASLSTQIFFDFWGGFGFVFLSSEALLLLDGPYSSDICMVLNVDFSLKFGRIELALAEVSSKIRRFLTQMTLF